MTCGVHEGEPLECPVCEEANRVSVEAALAAMGPRYWQRRSREKMVTVRDGMQGGRRVTPPGGYGA